METALGRGYSINEESGLTDFYSPPSSIADEDEQHDDDLFYPEDDDDDEEEIQPADDSSLVTSSTVHVDQPHVVEFDPSLARITNTSSRIDCGFPSLAVKMLPVEATPPPTPLVPRRPFDPVHATTAAFQKLTFNNNPPMTPTRAADPPTAGWSFATATDRVPKTPTSAHLLTPTSIDRYLLEQRPAVDPVYQPSLGTSANRNPSMGAHRPEPTNETSRLYSYMNPVDELPSPAHWSAFEEKASAHLNVPSYASQLQLRSPQRANPLFANSTSLPYQSQDPWFLSEMSTILRQNANISLSSRAQQILAANNSNNNRPLRSEKIDFEVIQHLIQEANWKRQCGMKKEVCVFCRNNGENELIYSSHALKDSMGNVTCPILRAYQCPICGATGSQAHTIKYCQATGDDNNRHVPTPYEKMLRMQSLGYDDSLPPSISAFLGHLDSPSSLYTNGWSDSYL